MSLEEFVDALCAILPSEFSDDKVLEVVRSNRVPAEALDAYTLWKPDRYTRNSVYRNDLFQVLVLCWNVGQSSPVHDHAGQRCWMTVEQGRLEVASYCHKRGGELEYMETEVVGNSGQDIHVDQCACVHQITNRCSWCEPAVSLQVYSRPFDSCYIYDLATGSKAMKELSCDMVGPLVAV